MINRINLQSYSWSSPTINIIHHSSINMCSLGFVSLPDEFSIIGDYIL